MFERMARVMAALSYIPKGRASGVSYEFRGIDALFNEIHEHLAVEGLFLSPRVLDDWRVNMIPGSPDSRGNARQQAQALFRVCIDVYAPDGTMVTLGPGLAQSHDYGDKAVYQAQQNAFKYVLLEAFAIPTQEPDIDSRVSDPVPQPEIDPAELSRLATNKLKVEAATLAQGDKEKAQNLFVDAVLACELDPEQPVPLDRVDDVRKALGE